MTRRLFGTLCGLVFLVNFGRLAFAPLVGELQTQFGVGPAAIGLVVSLVWWGTALPRIPVGFLLTRVSRYRIVLGTAGLLALSAAVTASATSVLVLQLGGLCLGIASGAYFVAAVPMVGELYPESIGRAVGIHGTSSQLAAVVAPVVAVAVLATSSWRTLFWLLGAGAVLSAVVLVVVGGDDVPTNAGVDRDFSAAFSHWRLLLLAIVMVSVTGFVWQGLFNFYVSYLQAAKGLTESTASSLLTVVFAAGVPAFWLSGRLADRLPHVPYVLGINAAFAALLFALTRASGLPTLVVLTAALGYVVHSLFPALDTYLLDTLPSSNRSAAYAIYSGLALLVEAGGSGAVGALTGAGYRYDVVFTWASVAIVFVIVPLALLYVSGKFPTARYTTDHI